LHHSELLGDVKLLQVCELECRLVLHTDVWAVVDAAEVVNQVHQLFVGKLVVVVGYDRYSVIKLVAEAVDGVVDDEQVWELSVLDDAQVFDVDALWRSDAVVSVEPILDELLPLLEELNILISVWSLIDDPLLFVGEIVHLAKLFLKGVKDHVCVALVAGCEDDDLVVLVGILKALVCKRADVDSCIYRLSGWKVDGDQLVVASVDNVVNAVDECLVKVKDKGLLVHAGREEYASFVDLCLGGLGHILHVLQALEGLDQVAPVDACLLGLLGFSLACLLLTFRLHIFTTGQRFL
jgi:hypothetical protein